MNFDSIIKAKKAWEAFKESHPKFPLFLNDVKKRGISENSIVEISIKYPDGSSIKSNIRINQIDINLLNELRSLM